MKKAWTYHLNRSADDKKYACPAIIQLLAQAFMGQVKTTKTTPDDKKATFDIDHDDFPDVTGDTLIPGSLGKEIPPLMLAYTGFAVRSH